MSDGGETKCGACGGGLDLNGGCIADEIEQRRAEHLDNMRKYDEFMLRPIKTPKTFQGFGVALSDSDDSKCLGPWDGGGFKLIPPGMFPKGTRVGLRWHVSLVLAWYDLYVGFYYDRKTRALYIMPIPCVGVRIQL